MNNRKIHGCAPRPELCLQMKQLLLLPKTNCPSTPVAGIEVVTLFSPISINSYQAVVRPRRPSHLEGRHATGGMFSGLSCQHPFASSCLKYGLDTPFSAKSEPIRIHGTLRKSPTNYENLLSPFGTRYLKLTVIRSQHLGPR